MKIAGDVITLTIASGQTASDVVDTRDLGAASVEMPAVMTGTVLSVKGKSSEAGTLKAVHVLANGASVAMTIPATVSTIMAADANMSKGLRGVRYLQLVSNASEAADRVFKVVLRG